MAKTLKEQQAFIGTMLGKFRAYQKRTPPVGTITIDQDMVDCLDAIYGNLKMIEVELAETKAEAEEAARPGEGPADNLGEPDLADSLPGGYHPLRSRFNP